MAQSLQSLQGQLTSLFRVFLQNHWVLDHLTAEKGETCLFLREKCCYYINELRVVKEIFYKLTCLSEDLLKGTSLSNSTLQVSSSLP